MESGNKDEGKVSKSSVNYRTAQRCGNCSMFSNGSCSLVAGEIDPDDVCDKWDSRDKSDKSAETPALMATPHLLGSEGLWHTPGRKVPYKQKLPNYLENVSAALMRAGHSEQESIAFAVNAIKRWASGRLGWGKRKVTPEVMAAAQKTLEEWEKLKATHH